MDADRDRQEAGILKHVAIVIAAVCAASCLLLPFLPGLKEKADMFLLKWEAYRMREETMLRSMTGLVLLEYHNQKAAEDAKGFPPFDSQIRIALPLGIKGTDIRVEQDLMERTFRVEIPYAGEDYPYEYPMLGSASHIERLDYENGRIYGTIRFALDRIYEAKTSFDEDYFYVDFLPPKEIYEKVIVIDAGHGGSDAGITKQGICEKDINLAIALKLKKLFDKNPDASIGIYYTRTADENPDAAKRAALGGKSDADLFVGIHCNSTESGLMSSIHGTQAAYSGGGEEAVARSKAFAQLCLEEVTAALGSANKGLRADDDGFLSGCGRTAAVIEPGFLTNRQELELLCQPTYQNKAAKGIYRAIMRALREGY